MAESAAVANQILREELSIDKKPHVKKEPAGHRLYNLALEINIKKKALIEEKKLEIQAQEDKIIELQNKSHQKSAVLMHDKSQYQDVQIFDSDKTKVEDRLLEKKREYDYKK